MKTSVKHFGQTVGP